MNINLRQSIAVLLLLGGSQAHASLVISQIYGGGGDLNAIYNYDYVEILNNSDSVVNLNGYSIQYASAVGTNWQSTILQNLTLAPNQYLLIREGTSNSAIGGSLPVFDASGIINIGQSAGKLALVSDSIVLSGSSPISTSILDFVGYGTANAYEGAGPAPAPSTTLALFRNSAGLTDTNNNALDFAAALPSPRNTLTPPASSPVPLPSAIWLLGSALTGMGFTSRRRRSARVTIEI